MPKVATVTKSIDDVLADFEKKTGLKVGTPEQVTAHTTGNMALDWQSGIGGIPRGRITELYGFESSGKTTTALQTAAALQRQILGTGSGESIVYLDFEHALDAGYAEDLGLVFDDKTFRPLQPSCLEEGGLVALDLIETGRVPLVVFDSVAAMAPRRQKDGDFDQATIQMHRAKLISALCSSMIEMIYRNHTAAIFINHKMESIEMSGRPGMPPKVTTPGGRGLKFYASLRLEFDVAGGVKDKIDETFSGEEENQLIGNRVFVKCVKNKVGVPGRVVELRNRYGHGFDNTWQALQVLMTRKVVKKAGAWFTFPPELSPDGAKSQIQGEHNILLTADENPEWGDQLKQTAQSLLAADVETP